MGTLIDDIVGFCETHGMKESKFGRLSMNDSALVLRMRHGRRIWPETEDRIRRWMRQYKTAKKGK